MLSFYVTYSVIEFKETWFVSGYETHVRVWDLVISHSPISSCEIRWKYFDYIQYAVFPAAPLSVIAYLFVLIGYLTEQESVIDQRQTIKLDK